MCLGGCGIEEGKGDCSCKTGNLRAVQMYLHLEVLECTADNFRLHIQGLFSPTAQRLCFQFRGVKSHPLLLTAIAFL